MHHLADIEQLIGQDPVKDTIAEEIEVCQSMIECELEAARVMGELAGRAVTPLEQAGRYRFAVEQGLRCVRDLQVRLAALRAEQAAATTTTGPART